ncbi:unnamed protein product [Allacma fusca]|uniref:long-chain-alcohol O-fatty-acyltransferase n=1 Tax=Allacma fusca TaxID=39272 RepID=A0A8J2K9I2_9HEXA|nr:unnamed protein product [Allacma fusca]
MYALYPYSKPNKTLNVTITFCIKGNLTPERLRQLFTENIMNNKTKEGQSTFERLQQTWTTYLGYTFWKTDRNFNLKNHIREYDYDGELSFPNPCQDSGLARVVGQLVGLPWEKNQSPWEILLAKDCHPTNSLEQQKTYFILRMDHVLGDGYSTLKFMELLFNLKLSVPKLGMNQRQLTKWQRFGMVVKIPQDFVENTLLHLLSPKMYDRTLSNQVNVSISPAVPVSLVKDIKNHFKVSYAAVLHSAVQGAIARGIHLAGKTPPKTTLCSLSFPVPNHPGGMVIHTTYLICELPCGAASPVDRLTETQDILKEASKSTVPLSYPIMFRILALYPLPVRRWVMNFLFSGGISYGMATFPVTNLTDYLDGMEVKDLMISFGTISSLGMMVHTGGVNNRHRFCFTVDKNAFGSEEWCNKLGGLVLEELRELAQRIPRS